MIQEQKTGGELFIDSFVKALEREIKTQFESVFEIKKQEMIEEMDKRKSEVVAALTIRMMNMVEMNTLGNRLRIEVISDKTNLK